MLATLDRFFLVSDRSIRWLDGLRVLAFLLVFWFHLTSGLYFRQTGMLGLQQSLTFVILGGFGWTGVPLFFVISGFLVGAAVVIGTIEGNLDPLQFFLRRIVRTVPPALALVVIAILLFPKNVSAHIDSTLFRTLFFVSNFKPGIAVFGHWWSLCVEEQFYLILCLFAVAFGAKMYGASREAVFRVLVFGAIIVSLTKIAFGRDPAIYQHTQWQLDFFLAGIAIRLRYECGVIRSKSAMTAVVGLVLCCGLYAFAALVTAFAQGNDVAMFSNIMGMPRDFLPEAEVMALVVAAALFIVVGFKSEILARLAGIRPIRWMAAMTYSLYLTHVLMLNFPVIPKIEPEAYGGWLDTHSMIYEPALFLIELILCVALGIVFYALVERPMLLLRKRFLKAPASKASATAI